jgi:hypothetical protein
MTYNRRRFIQHIGMGASAAYLSPLINWAQAQENPGQPRRFVFVIEGNGIEPGAFLSPNARMAIEAQATGAITRIANGVTQLNPRMNLYYGHETPLIVENDPLASAASLGALGATGDLGSLESKSAVLLGLSSKVTGGGHTTYGGAMTCTRSAAGVPAGPSIDAVLANLPSVRGQTPFDALRLGVGSSVRAVVHTTCAYGPKQPTPIILNPETAFDFVFGSVASANSIRQFEKRSKLLRFAEQDVNRRLNGFRGPAAERAKILRYGQSIAALKTRQTRLMDMAGDLARHIPAAPPNYNDGFQEAAPLVKLDDQFSIATAALKAQLTNVVVLASGSGLCGFDVPYSSLSRPCPTRHDLQHEAREEPVYRELIYEATGRHVALIARMARELDAIPEGGGSMLDNTVIIYMSDNGEQHHSEAEEWPMLLVGGNGLGLRTGGQTVVYPRIGQAENRQVSNIFNTLGHCAGSALMDFGGEGSTRIMPGPLPEVFG